jgi:hypothetical protein
VVVGGFSRGKTENFCRSVQDIKPCMQHKWNVPPDLKSAMGLKMQAVQKYSCISFLIPAQLHIIQGPKCVSNYLFRKIWIRLWADSEKRNAAVLLYCLHLRPSGRGKCTTTICCKSSILYSISHVQVQSMSWLQLKHGTLKHGALPGHVLASKVQTPWLSCSYSSAF